MKTLPWLDSFHDSSRRSSGSRALDFSQFEATSSVSEVDLSAHRLSYWSLNMSDFSQSGPSANLLSEFESRSQTGSHLSRSDSVQTSSSSISSSSTLSQPQKGGGGKGERYKTELCRPFEDSGTCKYGEKCQFAHGFAELRNVSRHPKYKTDKCRTFYTTGFCPYGQRCHFIHEQKRGFVTQDSCSSGELPLEMPLSPTSFCGNSECQLTSTSQYGASTKSQPSQIFNTQEFSNSTATQNHSNHSKIHRFTTTPQTHLTSPLTGPLADQTLDLSQLLTALSILGMSSSSSSSNPSLSSLSSVPIHDTKPLCAPQAHTLSGCSRWEGVESNSIGGSPTKSWASTSSPVPSPTSSIEHFPSDAFYHRKNYPTSFNRVPDDVWSFWRNDELSNVIST
jgi:hypothetical protein